MNDLYRWRFGIALRVMVIIALAYFIVCIAR